MFVVLLNRFRSVAEKTPISPQFARSPPPPITSQKNKKCKKFITHNGSRLCDVPHGRNRQVSDRRDVAKRRIAAVTRSPRSGVSGTAGTASRYAKGASEASGFCVTFRHHPKFLCNDSGTKIWEKEFFLPYKI